MSLLLAIGAFLALRKGGNVSTIHSKETLFAVSDSGSVNKIIITHSAESITLKNSNGVWMMNEFTLADQDRAKYLLTFIYDVQIKRPVYKEMVNTVNNKLNTEGIKLKLYDEDNLLKTYTVLLDSANGGSLEARMEGSDVPYTLQVPVETSFKTILSANINDWRSKEIFHSPPNHIKNITVTFSTKPSDSYKIERQNDKFIVLGMPEVDTLHLYSYIELYKSVKIKSYLTSTKTRDSLLNASPAFTISVDDYAETFSNTIKIYYSENQKGEIKALLGSKDELVIIRPGIFEYLLQKRSFFQKQNKI